MEEWKVDDGLEVEENVDESALSPQISVHALNDTADYRTMRVKGGVKEKMVHVLIYSGSSHNFMNINIVRKLGCKLDTIQTFFVSIANSIKVHNSYTSKEVTWKTQRVKFKVDMLVMPLGGADVVLGIQ